MIFLVLCYIYAGVDPGMDTNYRASYYSEQFETKEKTEEYLLKHSDESCSVYKAQKLSIKEKITVVTETKNKVTGFEIKP